MVIHKTHHSWVVLKNIPPSHVGKGYKHNRNFTNVVFPTQHELSPIHGEFIGHLEEGVKFVFTFKEKVRWKCHGHICSLTLTGLEGYICPFLVKGLEGHICHSVVTSWWCHCDVI